MEEVSEVDRVQLLEQYEREIGKPGSQWGSQEVQGFYRFIQLQEVRS